MTDTPPRRRRRSTPEDSETPQEQEQFTPSAPGRPMKSLQVRLEQFIVGIGLPFAAAGDMHCAMVFAQRGPAVAEAWAILAQESPAAKRMLEQLMVGGAWAGAIGSTVALVVPVARHHGLNLPDPMSAVIFGQNNDNVATATTETTDTNVTSPSATATQPSSNGGAAANPDQYAGIHPDDTVE